MSEEREVIEWFEKQIRDEGLTDLFSEFDAYFSWIKEDESILKYTKAIRQDLHKIFRVVEEVLFVEQISQEDTCNGEFLKDSVYSHRKIEFQGCNIEYIFEKFVSIFNHCETMVEDVFPEIENTGVLKKFEYLSKYIDETLKFLFIGEWREELLNIGNEIIYNGATVLVFNGEKLGFQIYDLDTNNLYFDSEYMKVNNNVYRLDMFILKYSAYLYHYIGCLLQAIVEKSDELFEKANISIDKTSMQQHLKFCSEHNWIGEYKISNIKVLQNWITEWKKCYREEKFFKNIKTELIDNDKDRNKQNYTNQEGMYDSFRLIPYTYQGIMYSLPTNASVRFKKHIQAAILSYIEGDYTFSNTFELVKDISIKNDILKDDRAMDSVVLLIKQMDDILKKIGTIKKIGPIYYSIAMRRLVSTYEGCLVLLRYGYFIESMPLFRLILEQISWSFAILDKNEEEIYKKGKATKYISCLEQIKPNMTKLYGEYSEQAHLDLPGIREYVFVEKSNNTVGYKTRSGSKSKERYWDYLLVCELYILSIEKVISKLGIKEEIIALPNTQKVTIIESLESIKQIFKINLEYFETGFITNPVTEEIGNLVFNEF